jgi:hypothetical protein
MLWCSHGLGPFAPEVHELSGNGFRDGLEQALHVLQLWPSFIQPVSSQRRQTGSLRGGGAAVLITATCLLVSSSSRFPIAVVSSMIDPFIFSSSVMLFVKWARSHLFASGLSDSTRLDRASGSRAAALLVPVSGQHAVRETMPRSAVYEAQIWAKLDRREFTVFQSVASSAFCFSRSAFSNSSAASTIISSAALQAPLLIHVKTRHGNHRFPHFD